MSSGIKAKCDYVTGLDNLTGEMTLNCQVTWHPNSSSDLTSKYPPCEYWQWFFPNSPHHCPCGEANVEMHKHVYSCNVNCITLSGGLQTSTSQASWNSWQEIQHRFALTTVDAKLAVTSSFSMMFIWCRGHEEKHLYDAVQRGECEDNVWRDDIEATRISNVYI